MSRSRITLSRLRTACGLLVLCLGVATASLSAAHAATPGKILQIRIPQKIDPGKLTILYGERRNGLGIGPLDTTSGVREYEVDLRNATSVKLLIYCPGYRMVTAEFDAAQISGSKIFAPRFVRLPMIPLRVSLVDTKGQPLVGEEVVLRHILFEMKYFNYGDGMVYPAVVATATTDTDGEIAVEVPSLPDDPYFSDDDERWPLGFELRLPRHQADAYGWDFVPRLIPAQTSYPGPVTVTLVYRGKISGRVTESFVSRAAVEAGEDEGKSDNSHDLWFEAMSSGARSGSGRRVAADGTFSMKLPAGSYDLFLEVRRSGGKFLRRLPLQTGFVLGEKEHRVLRLE